jgi:hypothetical protein
MSYAINNKPVGNHPDSIERTESYRKFLNKLGDSTKNIVTIPNFLTEEEISYFMEGIEERGSIRFVSQKGPHGEPLTYMHKYDGQPDKHNIMSRLKDEIEKAYDLGDIKILEKEEFLSVVHWETGSYLNTHVDDLGYVTENHLPIIIYLNDNYEGGEIKFETHDLSIKPKSGDLVMFPGNMHYAHEVTKVLSGDRYTLPIWFTVVE